MNCCYSPWLIVLWALCFAEDSILYHQNSITNFVIVVDVLFIFAFCAKISLALPVISYYVPFGYEGYVKEHFLSKYCHAWGGFEVISGANGPCRIVKEDINVIGGYWIGHINFSCAQYLSKYLWCTHSNIAFVCGFLFVVGLRLILYESHRYSKFKLNSLPLLYTRGINILGIYSTRMYWLVAQCDLSFCRRFPRMQVTLCWQL